MSRAFVAMKMNSAWQCLAAGHLAQAAREIDEAIEAAGPCAQTLALRAEIARREGRPSDAAALAQDVLDRFGPNVVAAGVLGKIALDRGDNAGALGHLRDAYRLHPSTYNASLLVDALEAGGRADEAAAFIEDVLQRMPGDVRFLHRAARFCSRAGRSEDAARHLAAILAIDPQNARARSMQLELRCADRPPEELAGLIEIGDRKHDPQMRGVYARQLRRAGDFAGAAAQFAEAARLDPSNDYWRAQAGLAFARARRDDDAVRFLRPEFLAKPQDKFIRSALFAALRRRKQHAELVALIDEALARHPDKMFLHGLRKKYDA